MMREVRNAIAAGWRLFLAIYLVTLLLEWAVGWAGLGIALAFVLGHYLRDFPRRNRSVLQLVEDWYFNDDVLDPIKPVDADDAGDAA